MFKIKNELLIFITFFTFFLIISSVSATNYYVNNDTTHKNISDWMKNNAKNGDNLIFNTSSYELSDTLVISKSLNIKSSKNTEINFILEKNMINITAKSVNFTNLRLKHVFIKKIGEKSTYGLFGMITAQGTYKNINMKNIQINFEVNKSISNYTGPGPGSTNTGLFNAIDMRCWKGNIKNCNISTKGESCSGIFVGKWKGSIINSTIKTEGRNYSIAAIQVSKWKGNIINSTISSFGPSPRAMSSYHWSGKIIESKIYSFDTNNYSSTIYPSTALYLPNSKGSLYKSTIKASNGYAMMITDEVKITNCKVSSKNGLKKYYLCQADLRVKNVEKFNNAYFISVGNDGFRESKPCFISITTWTGKIIKKVKIKSIMGKQDETTQVKLPTKYANKYYTKYIQFGNYKKNKKEFKDNYSFKFKI